MISDAESVERADLIVRALAAEDADLATYRLLQLRAPDLRVLCMELARRVPPPVTGEGSVLDAATKAAAASFGVEPEEIMSPTRRRQVVEARHVVCYTGHLLGMPLAHIGRHIERDHTSVMNAVSKVGSDRRLRNIAASIAGQLGWDREAS